MLYHVLRVIAGRALTWFYSRVDVEGVERIPRDDPILLAVNHPNALVDALVVGHVVPRRLGFTARATLFTNPVLAAFLRAVGVVPLIRQKDVAELGATSGADRNARAFAAINSALACGGAVMIFPEGITGDHTQLAPLKTGAARIALGAVTSRGSRAFPVVPVGLVFRDKDVFRSERGPRSIS